MSRAGEGESIMLLKDEDGEEKDISIGGKGSFLFTFLDLRMRQGLIEARLSITHTVTQTSRALQQ
jgi:hypothetical protein